MADREAIFERHRLINRTHPCEVWPRDEPCGLLAIERLVYCNERCAGTGRLWVCAGHLAEHRAEHLL